MKKAERKLNPRKQTLKAIHPNAAGIDIGSKTHYAAVPEDRCEQPVRHFGCLTPDLHELAKWLKSCGMTTVAMEATGVYWIPVARILEEYGLEVLLVDARNVRSVPGRKSDVFDCQWLQELHSYGLLRGAFRPAQEMEPLRTYWRHRACLVEQCASEIHRMQKALEQMNLQLHKVISDISGVTGFKIIRAIVAGERDPRKLAQMRQAGVKNSEETIAKALTGHYREDHLFTLQQALETYDFLQKQICECDLRIETAMKRLETRLQPSAPSASSPPKKTFRRKNQPYFDLRLELYRMLGVDLTRIDGIDALTAQTIITEQGYDMGKFPTEKHFTSHLGLCPNNRITGGKVKRRRSRRVQSRAACALRVAAQSLHHNKSALGAYFRRMKARLGPAKAITATARKLAVLVYRLLKYGEDYVDQGQELYETRYQLQRQRILAKQAETMGFKLIPLSADGGVS
ncbi:MAG: IS110 family transposase [Candidatus Omnitrophica bacterium]|nr:IS110 family transposase [Candidatus Omnitrophota bacterium]